MYQNFESVNSNSKLEWKMTVYLKIKKSVEFRPICLFGLGHWGMKNCIKIVWKMIIGYMNEIYYLIIDLSKKYI